MTTEPFQPLLWPSVWKLLRLQSIIIFNNIRRANTRRKIGYTFLALLVLAVLVGTFIGSWFLLGLLQSPSVAQYIQPAYLIDNLPVWIFAIAFLGLLVTSFGVLLQALYLSGDMEFLLSAPLPIRSVFVAKLIEAILPNFGFVLLLGLPVLIGLGAAQHFSLLYYPFLILLLTLLALAIAGLSSLLVMSIVRVVPAKRVAEVIGFVGVLASFFCSQSGQFMNTVNVSSQQLSGTLTRLAWLGSPWSPIAWAARGLIGIGRGEWLPGLGWTVLFIGLTSVIFYASLVTAERLYINGWARVQVGTRRKKRSTTSTTRPSTAVVVKPDNAGLLTRRIPAPIRAVMMKDYRVLSRDLRNLSQIVSPILIGVLYAVMLGRGGQMTRHTEIPAQFSTTIQSVIIYANVGISLFVSWGLLSRLSLMSFSQEGSHYWLIKTAPINPRQLLLSKYMVAYLPSLALGWVFMLAIFFLQGGELSVLFYGMAMIAFSTAGAVGISLSFGIAGANLKWENPRAMIRGTAGCVSSLVSFLYLGGIVAIFFGPTVIFNLLGLPGIYGILAGLVVGIPVSLACTYFPPRAVMSRITRIGEE